MYNLKSAQFNVLKPSPARGCRAGTKIRFSSIDHAAARSWSGARSGSSANVMAAVFVL